MESLYKTATLVIVLGILATGFSYIQAGYTPPVQNPPGGNVDAPINLDDDFQDITGGLEADAIGVTYGMSIGGVSRTACPNPPGDCYPPPTQTTSCHLQVRRVDWTTGTRTFTEDKGEEYLIPQSKTPVCDDYLTDQAKAAGWAASGEDNCMGTDGTNCSTMRPSTCMYMRLVCTPSLQVSQPSAVSAQYSPGLYPLLPASHIDLPKVSTSTNPL